MEGTSNNAWNLGLDSNNLLPVEKINPRDPLFVTNITARLRAYVSSTRAQCLAYSMCLGNGNK